jgi:hypothetical protein
MDPVRLFEYLVALAGGIVVIGLAFGLLKALYWLLVGATTPKGDA